MGFDIRKTEKHYGLQTGELLKIAARLAASPDVTEADIHGLRVSELQELVDEVAASSAQCKQCSTSFLPRSRNCRCGAQVGRCPRCDRYTSVSLVKSRFLSDDEYKCNACHAEIVVCHWQQESMCYGWALGDGHCPVCHRSKERLAKKRDEAERDARAFTDGLERGLQAGLSREISRRQAQKAVHEAEYRAYVKKNILKE